MIRSAAYVMVLLGAIALLPQTAHAWSEQPLGGGQGDSSRFTDPDAKLERLNGSSNSSDSGYSSRSGSQQGGVTFSVTQQPINGLMPIGPIMGGPPMPVPGR